MGENQQKKEEMLKSAGYTEIKVALWRKSDREVQRYIDMRGPRVQIYAYKENELVDVSKEQKRIKAQINSLDDNQKGLDTFGGD